MKRLLAGAAFCAACLAAGSAGAAASIQFTPVDLPNVTPGFDLWQYEYSVSGNFVAFGGFNLLFSPTLYAQLENPPPAINADWFASTLEPDPGLPADGLYSATALIGSPSLADKFIVSFVWLGNGTPGAQPFEVFDDSFNITESGRTRTPGQPVPEPGTLGLLAGALLLARRLSAKL
ncbi:MAG: hypothetical protein KF778_17105 [Rhodocyclaceae bacterium]|nr:hypothetical protein [Rhodocyclaceae bacterium]